MSDIVRILAHPTDHSVVIVRVPHGSNQLMGRFEPAQLSTDHNGYLVHIDQLDTFERFATYAGLYTLDERGLTARESSQKELCDVCMKPERLCQTSAGNRGSLRDHAYLPTWQADQNRSRKQLPGF